VSKLPEKVVEEVIVAQTTDPLKSKGKTDKKSSSFFWEAYHPSEIGKRSIMKKWAQDIDRSMNYRLEFDKQGNIEETVPVQRVKAKPVEHKNKKGK
jgi:hypothetical protein